ncbi:MAG: phosphocarrier protein HPr [Myxococcota bacterium]|jgi:phosphocarrier protein HPr
MPSLSREFVIVNEKGLHARAATALVKTALAFGSTTTVHRGATKASAKSVMGLLILAAPVGSTIRIEIEGEDADLAMERIGALIQNGFGE